MKKAMHLQDMEVKNAAEWKVRAEVGWVFLALESFQSEAAQGLSLGRACGSHQLLGPFQIR